MKSGPAIDRHRGLLQGLALIGLAFLVYIPATQCGFIWDDDNILTENPLIRAADGLYRFWLTTEPADYFPLTYTTLWLEWRLWGYHPAGYHVLNILLHTISCVLLWRVLRRLRIPGSWLAAALFAVHPITLESVVWIIERKNTLPMVFYLLSLLLYLRFEDSAAQKSRGRLLYAASLAAFLLALLAKTSVVILPLALLLATWWRRGRVGIQELRRIAPFLVLSLILGLVTVWYQTYRAIGHHHDLVRSDGFLSRLAIAGWAVWFYLYKALVPVNLCFVYPRWEADTAWWGTYVPLVTLIGCFGVLWRYRKGCRPVLLAMTYYVLALLPVLGFVNIYFMRYSLVADHWQYVALVGIVTLAASGLISLLTRIGLVRVIWPVAGVLIMVLGSLSWNRQGAYRNVDTMWTDTVQKNPSAWMAYNGLGLVRQQQGRFDEAIAHYEKALQLNAESAGVHYNLGNTLQILKRREDAIAHYDWALRVDPDYAEAHNNLGSVLYGLGRLDEAVSHLREAVRLKPSYASARTNLGCVLHDLGRFAEAIREHSEAVRLDPSSAVAHYNLGNSLQMLGRFTEAAAHYTTALRIEPNHLHVLNKFAWLLATCPEAATRSGPRALELAERVVRATGENSAVPLSTLAAAHAELGDFVEAVRWQAKAIALLPDAAAEPLRKRLEMYRQHQPYREAIENQESSH